MQTVRADLADAGDVRVVLAERPLGVEREVAGDGLGQVEVVLTRRVGTPAGDLVVLILRKVRRRRYRAAEGDDPAVEQLALRAVFKPDCRAEVGVAAVLRRIEHPAAECAGRIFLDHFIQSGNNAVRALQLGLGQERAVDGASTLGPKDDVVRLRIAVGNGRVVY